MEHPTAFRRVWDNLAHHRGAVLTARITAIAAALCTVVLLGVLALFVDLLISQGRIPAYHELGDEPRTAFDAAVHHFTGDARSEALEAIGIPGDKQPPFDTPFESASPVMRERLWRAYVWDLLRRRVGESAATTFAERAKTVDPFPAEAVSGLGILSLVARTHGLRIGAFVGWVASWNPWAWLPTGGPNSWYLLGLLILALVFAFARSVLMNVMAASAASAALAVSVRLRRGVYHHTYRLGTLTIRTAGPAEAISLFIRHIEAIHDAVYADLTSQFFCPVEVVLLLTFALAIHFWLAIAFLLAAVIVLLVGGQMAGSLRRAARREDRRATARMSLLQESLMMMRLVKSNVMELFNQSRVERQLAEYADARVRRARAEAVFKPMIWFLGAAATVVLLYVAGLIVLAHGLGAANVIVLSATLVTAYWPIHAWLRHRRQLDRGRESAAAVYEFLDRPREVGQVVGAEFMQGVSKEIEFHDVSLREPSTGRLLLENVNLIVGSGERVGLVGSDEAEKHAVVYLLARFLDPSAGEVRVDGKGLRWLTLDSLRTQIGLVLQPHLVFNDTISHNIGCGDPTFTVPEIIEAAKIAHAHQFIQRLPYGYETPIGELGTSLRPGEQFRIALARAILRDPAVYVIEEPAVPLDDDTKALLDDTFSRILPGKTVLFLPHRVSTVRSCDRLYLIHRGQVEAVGGHRDLIAGNDLYRHLHYLEFNEFAEQV